AVTGGEGRTPFAVKLLLTLAFTNATISAGILTATVPNLVTVEFLAKAGRPVTFTDWLVYGFPPALVMTFLTWVVIQLVFKSGEASARPTASAVVEMRLVEMGRTTAAEWRSLAIFLLVVAGWATQSWTKLDSTVVCLIGAGLLFLPKIGVIDWP